MASKILQNMDHELQDVQQFMTGVTSMRESVISISKEFSNSHDQLCSSKIALMNCYMLFRQRPDFQRAIAEAKQEADKWEKRSKHFQSAQDFLKGLKELQQQIRILESVDVKRRAASEVYLKHQKKFFSTPILGKKHWINRYNLQRAEEKLMKIQEDFGNVLEQIQMKQKEFGMLREQMAAIIKTKA